MPIKITLATFLCVAKFYKYSEGKIFITTFIQFKIWSHMNKWHLQKCVFY
jgi:hypothetical protein